MENKSAVNILIGEGCGAPKESLCPITYEAVPQDCWVGIQYQDHTKWYDLRALGEYFATQIIERRPTKDPLRNFEIPRTALITILRHYKHWLEKQRSKVRVLRFLFS